MTQYFGRYADFQTASKKEAAVLLGADNMIGDVLDVECDMDATEHRAWLVNERGQRVGFFGADLSRELSLQRAKGLELHAIMAFVAFTDHPDEGHYWGEVALVCFATAEAAAFETFLNDVAKKIGQGVRPAVDLGPDGVRCVIESDGAWLPDKRIPMPEKAKGTAIIKNRRGLNDYLITQGRAGNKGCYVASWIFLLAVVALAIFGLKSCFF